MNANTTPIEVSAALAATRRRARLLDQAQGGWHWTELVGIVVALVLAVSLMATDDGPTSSDFGFVIVLGAIVGAQYRRLQARIDALTKIVTEIGYPGEA